MSANTESKDKILLHLKESSAKLEEEIVSTVCRLTLYTAVIMSLIVLLLVLICIIALVYMDIVSSKRGLITMTIVIVYFVILSVVFVTYSTDFCEKRFSKAGEIYNNYIASEDVLVTIEGAAGAYLKATGA